MDSRGRVDAIVMASGFSRRFGAQNKLLLPFKGVPLARRTLLTALGSSCFNTVYFVYSQAEVGALAKGLDVQAIHNPNAHQGQSAGIRLGVAASLADHYLFCPCDQPFLDASTLQAIVSARGLGKIVFPVHAGRPGSPALFSAAFRPLLLALQPGRHARDIRRQHPEAQLPVEIPSPLPLRDIDTPQDLDDLLALAGAMENTS